MFLNIFQSVFFNYFSESGVLQIYQTLEAKDLLKQVIPISTMSVKYKMQMVIKSHHGMEYSEDWRRPGVWCVELPHFAEHQ